MNHLVITEDGERITLPLERLSPNELRSLIDAADERLDIVLGNCTNCHGSGRERGDETFECFACGGTGKHEDEVRRLENDYDEEEPV